MAIAIGDIHGCLSPLERLVARLPPDRELVFLGDYVDRGPQSAGVLAYLQQLAGERTCRFLMGNHEDLMLQALESAEAIPNWLYNGGTTTLRSFGLDPNAWSRSPPVERAAFVRPHSAFLRGLAYWHEDAHAIYVHAGVDPRVPRMEEQDPAVLMWIRERFYKHPEAWGGKPVIFGHTPTLTMGLPPKQIFSDPPFYGIDTGCCFGGYLTAMDAETHALYQERSDHRRTGA